MTEYILYAIEDNGNKFVMRRDTLIEDMDSFTSIFCNAKDMEETLNEVHKSSVKIKELYLFKKGKYQEETLPIKYSNDRFDELSVIEQYKNYLWLNPKQIMYSNVKHVRLDFMQEYKETGKAKFSENEFNMAIRAYFYRDGKIVYAKVREAYFELLQLGQKVKCKKR